MKIILGEGKFIKSIGNILDGVNSKPIIQLLPTLNTHEVGEPVLEEEYQSYLKDNEITIVFSTVQSINDMIESLIICKQRFNESNVINNTKEA